MDTSQIVQNVRKLVGDAEVEQGLKQLIAFLQPDDQYDELNRLAIQSLSQLQKTKKDEALGIISFENAKLSYNQVNNQVLYLLDRLESGELKSEATQQKANKRWIWVAATVLILVVAGIFVIRAFNLGNRPGGNAQVAQACPTYGNNSPFNILLFRFQNFGGAVLNTHQAVRRRLGQLGDRFGIAAEVGIFDDKGDDDQLPANLRQAEQIGEGCMAQLVLMGTEESRGNNAIITTQYRFLNLGEHFPMTKLQITERQDVDTVTAISSITTEGRVIGNLEQSILLLFGVVAFNTQNTDAAIALLENAEVTDSASTLLRDMMLGNSYLKVGDKSKAVTAYDKVLALHPDYPLALQNRATLYFEKGDYLGAANDFTTRIERAPNDADAHEQRGTIYLKIDQLDKARKDLEIAKKLKPKDQSILRKIEQVERKEIEQRKIKKDAEDTLRADPNNVNALNQRADASKNLGDYRTAMASAEKVLQLDDKNTKALSTLVESAQELNRPEVLEQILQRIQKSNINTEQLKTLSPTFYRIQKIDSALIERN